MNRDRMYGIPILFTMQRDSGGGGGEGGGDGTTGTGDDDGGSADDDGDGSGKNSGASDDHGGDGEDKPYISFPSEASFNRRLRQQARQLITEEFKDLGVDSLDGVKQLAQQAKDQEQQQKTEADRQKERADRAERDRDEARRQAQEDRLRARVERLSTTDDEKVRAKFDKIVDPDTAFMLMNREGIEIDEDGSVSGVEEALAALIAEKPFLKVTATEPGNTVPKTPKDNTKGKDGPSYAARYLTGKYKGPQT